MRFIYQSVPPCALLPSCWGMLKHVRKEGGNSMLTKCKHTIFLQSRAERERMKIRERNFRHFSAMHYQKSESIRMVGFPAQKKQLTTREKLYQLKSLVLFLRFTIKSTRCFHSFSSLSFPSSLKKKHTESKKKLLLIFFLSCILKILHLTLTLN